MDALDVVKLIISIVVGISLIMTAVFVIKDVLVPIIQIGEAESNISAGEIVDKKIINARSGLFTSSDMDYRLVIEGEYEYKGKTINGQKSISVDKETYLQVNIGDWFDSQTLQITPKNN